MGLAGCWSGWPGYVWEGTEVESRGLEAGDFCSWSQLQKHLQCCKSIDL